MEIIILKQPENPHEVQKVCPFGAIDILSDISSGDAGKAASGMPVGQTLSINAGCRFCRLCVKKCPEIFAVRESPPAARASGLDARLKAYRGIAVYIERSGGRIHPVSLELLGKGRKLADTCGQRLLGVLIGGGKEAEEILHYPVDELYQYRHPSLGSFCVEPYAALFEDFINEVKPSVVIVGGTVVGRSLAPRVAARFRTGLTADCTVLDISASGGLEQIRPAFGGNIMAHIRTPDFRPQFATVRYKIFDAPKRSETKGGELIVREVSDSRLKSGIRVIESKEKPEVFGIEDAQVIIAVGRGLKKKSDLGLVEDLASALKAQIAGTRPMIESGLLDPRRQIGLSGRTVKPALILTLGVSGSVQFVAGMKSSDRIIAVNTDRSAPIFNVAHIGIVGDLYEVLPTLLTLVKERGKHDAV